MQQTLLPSVLIYLYRSQQLKRIALVLSWCFGVHEQMSELLPYKTEGRTWLLELTAHGQAEQMCQARKSPTQQDFPYAQDAELRRNQACKCIEIGLLEVFASTICLLNCAKLSACTVVSSNVFLSYFSRSIWGPPLSQNYSVDCCQHCYQPCFIARFWILQYIFWDDENRVEEQAEKHYLSVQVGVFPESIYFQTSWNCFQTWYTCSFFPEISGCLQYHI